MGGPELVVVLAIAMPVVVALWFARLIYRIQQEQRAIRDRLEVIERSVPRESPKEDSDSFVFGGGVMSDQRRANLASSGQIFPTRCKFRD
jgi:hypothetical protein